MLLNSKMVLAFCCLGIETATALCHSEGMVCLVQVILIRVHSSFSTAGQLLYSFYDIPLGPGAEADLARWIICLTLLNFGGDASNRADDSEGLGTYPGESRDLFLAGSLYWVQMCFCSSFLETSRMPLVFSWRSPRAQLSPLLGLVGLWPLDLVPSMWVLQVPGPLARLHS